MIDYKISYSIAEGAYQTLETGVVTQTYTAISLTPGVVYGFKIQARNSFGYSALSDGVLVMAAKVPVKPAAPTTTFNRETVQIDWIEPDSGGSAILGYRIYIRESDESTYSLELDDCDGSSSQTIIDSQQCTVKVSTLRDAPFSLPWGAGIYAQVIAFNSYGDSETSDAGNGAVIITYADAPLDVIEVVAQRAADSITISWTEGLANGGSTVTDYRINSDGALNTYSIIASGVTTTYYTATGLTAGLIYKFKVEANNEFGYSAFSSEVSILCATVPSKIATPTTTVVNSDVIFDWDAPSANGLPITEYKVLIRKSDLVFIIDTSSCDGSSSPVMTNTECTVPLSKLTAAPFLLLKGFSINIQVIATNAYGDSIVSDTGTGAVI